MVDEPQINSPESRATAVTVFVLTVILAAVVWQYSQHFRVVVD